MERLVPPEDVTPLPVTVPLTAGIPLEDELDAVALVLRTEVDGLWEKTLLVRFPSHRRVLGTNNGFLRARAVMNHSAHHHLWHRAEETLKDSSACGGKRYLEAIRKAAASRLGISEAELAYMGTAADLDNGMVATCKSSPVTVAALVTAGAETNALRTGTDEGTSVEPDNCTAGTVNIIILTNARLSDAAMTRAIITVTEAKTAAFEDLLVPSSYTKGVQATGTGTDSVVIVSGNSGPTVTYTGGHGRIGCLIGRVVHKAVIKALERQNGFRLTRE